MTFLPDLATFLTFTLASVILFITPGPDMSLVLAKTISGGTRIGIAATLGAHAGLCVHTVLAAIGVSAILAASATAFMILKIVGALYLGWLAIDALRHGSALNVRDDGKPEHSLWRAFILGVASDLSNPKVVLFFVTFLPQFVSSGDPHAMEKMLFLGLYYIAISVPATIGLVIVARRLTATLKARPRIMRMIDYVFASVFGAFALTILRTQGR